MVKNGRIEHDTIGKSLQILTTMDKQQSSHQYTVTVVMPISKTKWILERKGDQVSQSHIYKAKQPGDANNCQSIWNHLSQRFIGQKAEELTYKCLVVSTIFTDHTSDLSQVYHQTSMISQETLKNKLAFERVAVMHEVLQSCRHWEIQRTSL